ncbi:hypothetical protein MMC17_006025 [Xylographa soralifera]|nr:hypothetical protein [Xylographa soralifera]
MNRLNDHFGYDAFRHRFPNAPKPDVMAGSKMSPFLQPRLLSEVQHACMGGDEFVGLKDLIIHTRTCKCADLRDKVFSVLGLADPEVYKLAVNYRLSVKETFIAVARSLMLQEKSVDMLSACQNPGRRHGLPSWVPNLADGWKARPFKSHLHQASYDGAQYTFGEDENILKIKGSSFDIIETISEDTVHEEDTIERLDAVYRNWRSFIRKALSNPEMEWGDRYYIKEDLLGIKSEHHWTLFLSLNKTGGRSLLHPELVELLPEPSSGVIDTSNFHKIKSLLLPEDFLLQGKRYKVLHKSMRDYGVGRRICLSRRGIIGLIPADTLMGDLICILHGAAFPYILRKQGKHYLLVGEAYLPQDNLDLGKNLKEEYFSII